MSLNLRGMIRHPLNRIWMTIVLSIGVLMLLNLLIPGLRELPRGLQWSLGAAMYSAVWLVIRTL